MHTRTHNSSAERRQMEKWRSCLLLEVRKIGISVRKVCDSHL